MREWNSLSMAGSSTWMWLTLPSRVAPLLLLLTIAGCSHQDMAGKPEALIESAWRDFRIQDFQSAAINLKSALHKLDELKAHGHPLPNERALRINALYGLGLVGTVGRAGGNAGGSSEGRRYLHQVIAMAGHGEMAAWAELGLIRDAHLPQTSGETIDIPRLRTLYRDLINAYPKSKAAEEAFVYLQSLYVETLQSADAHDAVATISAYLAANPQAAFRSALHSLAARAQVILKNYPAALQDSIAALDTKEIDAANPQANNVLEYYDIGLMAEYDVGDFATARKYYRKFLDAYPADQRAFNIKLELARMDRMEKELRPGSVEIRPEGVRQ